MALQHACPPPGCHDTAVAAHLLPETVLPLHLSRCCSSAIKLAQSTAMLPCAVLAAAALAEEQDTAAVVCRCACVDAGATTRHTNSLPLLRNTALSMIPLLSTIFVTALG